MNKPLSIAIALVLALAGSSAQADDTTRVSTTTKTTMHDCVTQLKAKNDGTSDAVIQKTCTSKIAVEKSHSKANNVDGAVTSGPSSETSTTTVEQTTTDTAPPQ